MENFVDMNVIEANKLARKKSFNMVVSDSTFVVGKEGGTIVLQNPKAGAEVKKGRKVYVTITKFDPDKIKVSELPVLYGNDFNQKMVELGYKGLKCKIRTKKFDRGEPNHILEVYYKGKLIVDQIIVESDVAINKGETLEFIVSEREGGEFIIPKLTCLTLDEAEFLLSSQELAIGEITEKGAITDRGSSYILLQEPHFDGLTKVAMGSKINVTIAQGKSLNCK
jgi:beta-lactam-binding protein with PASTA domain